VLGEHAGALPRCGPVCATLTVARAAAQGRGGSTGYDNAVALPARADAEELAKENQKSTVALKGQAVFSVAKARAHAPAGGCVRVSVSPACSASGRHSCGAASACGRTCMGSALRLAVRAGGPRNWRDCGRV